MAHGATSFDFPPPFVGWMVVHSENTTTSRNPRPRYGNGAFFLRCGCFYPGVLSTHRRAPSIRGDRNQQRGMYLNASGDSRLSALQHVPLLWRRNTETALRVFPRREKCSVFSLRWHREWVRIVSQMKLPTGYSPRGLLEKRMRYTAPHTHTHITNCLRSRYWG